MMIGIHPSSPHSNVGYFAEKESAIMTSPSRSPAADAGIGLSPPTHNVYASPETSSRLTEMARKSPAVSPSRSPNRRSQEEQEYHHAADEAPQQQQQQQDQQHYMQYQQQHPGMASPPSMGSSHGSWDHQEVLEQQQVPDEHQQQQQQRQQEEQETQSAYSPERHYPQQLAAQHPYYPGSGPSTALANPHQQQQGTPHPLPPHHQTQPVTGARPAPPPQGSSSYSPLADSDDESYFDELQRSLEAATLSRADPRYTMGTPVGGAYRYPTPPPSHPHPQHAGLPPPPGHHHPGFPMHQSQHMPMMSYGAPQQQQQQQGMHHSAPPAMQHHASSARFYPGHHAPPPSHPGAMGYAHSYPSMHYAGHHPHYGPPPPHLQHQAHGQYPAHTQSGDLGMDNLHLLAQASIEHIDGGGEAEKAPLGKSTSAPLERYRPPYQAAPPSMPPGGLQQAGSLQNPGGQYDQGGDVWRPF